MLETLRRLWSLFLAFFRSKPEKHMSKAVLPLSSKVIAVGKPELLSPPRQRQRRGCGLTSTGRSSLSISLPMQCLALTGPRQVSHPNNPRAPDGLPLPSIGRSQIHLLDRGIPTHSWILPGGHFGPPPRPPRPQSISVVASEVEFSTPVISDVRLPSVIVTPCTPSTKASKTYISTGGLDELNSDENGDSSGSDYANSSITSVDSNPFLSHPSLPLHKGIESPPLGPGALNNHHRARSLTGTGRSLHQRLSRTVYFIRGKPPLPRGADTRMLPNPVKKSDSPLLIGDSVTPIASKTSFIRSSPNFVCDSKSEAIAHQRIRSYMTSTTLKKSAGQMLVRNVTVGAPHASTRHSEDQKVGAAASGVAQTSVLAYKNATVMDKTTAPSNLTPSVLGHAQLGVVPYAEVFDLDSYFDSVSSLPSEIIMKSSMNASYSTIDSSESKNPFLIPSTASPNYSSSAIFASPQPLRSISNISDTTASSTSIYTHSSSNASTDMDESASSNPRRFGFLHNGRKSKVTPDNEAKRYRDHYRAPAYSRSPAFVIESPTTSRKFTGKSESDGISIDSADKEHETVSPTSSPTRTKPFHTKLANPISPQCSTTWLPSSTTSRAPVLLVRHQQGFGKSFHDQTAQVNCTLDSSTTAASISPAGATRHRLGSVAISQRRQM